MTDNQTTKELTDGEYRVDITFNPADNPDVDHIKSEAAALIDFVLEHGKNLRVSEIAATAIENAAMWAVKSVTKKEW